MSDFEDRSRRGPKPLLDEPTEEYVERLLEEESPTEHGWLRSRWSCKLLAVELIKERAALVSRETLRRVLHRLGFRWRRPHPVPPEKDSEDYQEQKRRRLLDILSMLKQAGSFFQDETRLETNPKVGLCWMRKGSQRRLKTPVTNHKVWISGALNFKTGRLHWVRAERKNEELFIELLDQSRRTYRCHRESCTWQWTMTQATPPNGSRHTWRIRAHPFAPTAFMVSGEQSGGAGVVVFA